MSTRGVIIVKDAGERLLSIYNHFDSYPTGLGLDLYEILKDSEIINGFTINGYPVNKQYHNGMGCIASTLIAKMKKQIGDVYIRNYKEY